jgi:hypothetical protein
VARLSRVGAPQLVVGTVLLATLARTVQPQTDPDYFWHVAVGRWILDHRAIPHTDLFTWSVPDHRFIAHEWLSEVAMAALAGSAGIWAVSLLFGLVTFAGFALLLATARDAGWLLRALAVFLGLIAAAPILGPRSQMLTFALSALELWLLRRWRDDGQRRWLYPLPPLYVLWANAHAGFTFGLGLLAIHLAGEWLTRRFGREGSPARLGDLAVALAGCLVACAINPNLLAIYPYALQTQASPVQQALIAEWASPDFHLAEIRAFEVMLVGLPLLWVVGRARVRPTDLLLVLAGTALALQSIRHIALFVVLATPALAEAAQGAWEAWPSRPTLREPPRRAALGAANLAILVLVAAIVGLYARGRLRQQDAEVRRSFPVAAYDAVAADPPPGHLLDLYEWGGYSIYRLAEPRPVFVYGDAAVMGDDFLRRYEAIAYIQPDWRSELDRWGVEWVVDGTDKPLTTLLSASPGWVVLHHDPVATVLVRRDATTAAYLAAHGLG